jgi:hypothetical protein
VLARLARERWDLLADAAAHDARPDERLRAKLAKERKLSWRQERRQVRSLLRAAA